MCDYKSARKHCDLQQILHFKETYFPILHSKYLVSMLLKSSLFTFCQVLYLYLIWYMFFIIFMKLTIKTVMHDSC